MIVFISNFFNHHQAPVAQELFILNHGEYRFIELEQMPESFKQSGYTVYEDTPFVVRAWKDKSSFEQARELVNNARIVVFGNLASYDWIKERLDAGKITFQYGERWLKRGLVNLLSPNLVRYLRNYNIYLRGKPLYHLCASAYAARDLKFLRVSSPGFFKWGYFPTLPDVDIENRIACRRKVLHVSFISVGRLIGWKNHKLILQAAKILKDKNIEFKVDIYGDGPLKDILNNQIKQLNIAERVSLKGTLPNEHLLREMKNYDALIFTSTQREGWGAVSNEAMGSGCPIIGAHKIGSVPYLVQDGVNGLVFKCGDAVDLALKMEKFIGDIKFREAASRAAYQTIVDMWSPKIAARRLFELFQHLENGNGSPFRTGPCSEA